MFSLLLKPFQQRNALAASVEPDATNTNLFPDALPEARDQLLRWRNEILAIEAKRKAVEKAYIYRYYNAEDELKTLVDSMLLACEDSPSLIPGNYLLLLTLHFYKLVNAGNTLFVDFEYTDKHKQLLSTQNEVKTVRAFLADQELYYSVAYATYNNTCGFHTPSFYHELFYRSRLFNDDLAIQLTQYLKRLYFNKRTLPDVRPTGSLEHYVYLLSICDQYALEHLSRCLSPEPLMDLYLAFAANFPEIDKYIPSEFHPSARLIKYSQAYLDRMLLPSDLFPNGYLPIKKIGLEAYAVLIDKDPQLITKLKKIGIIISISSSVYSTYEI